MSEIPAPITPFLEPEAKELAEATAPHPRIYEVPPEEGRKILLDLQSGEGVERPDVDEEWVEVDAGEWGTVRTRIIRPKGATGDLPVLFYIHGAGWVFGDDKTHDRLFRELTVGANAVGVFPVYDRAPEKKYPTQVEQNYAVGQWVATNGADHGMDTSRIAVTGESVGGDMSAVFALMNKDRGGLDLKAQALLYPVTNADFDTPSYIQFEDGYYLTRDGMKWFWDAYTTDEAQRKEKYASPAAGQPRGSQGTARSPRHYGRGRRPPRRGRAVRQQAPRSRCPCDVGARGGHGPRLPPPRQSPRHEGGEPRPHSGHRLPPQRPPRGQRTVHGVRRAVR